MENESNVVNVENVIKTRVLNQNEYLEGVRLAWKVFSETTISFYAHMAIEDFRNLIKMENVTQACESGNMILWGAFEGEAMIGISALTREGYIKFLFVEPPHQLAELGNELFRNMYMYATQNLGLTRLFALVIPAEVDEYRRFGFYISGPNQRINETDFLPLEQMVAPADITPRHKKSQNGLIIGIVAAALMVLVLFGVLFSQLMRRFVYQASTLRNEYVSQVDDEDIDIETPDTWDEQPIGQDFVDEFVEEDIFEEEDVYEEDAFLSIPYYWGPDVEYTIDYDSYFESEWEHEKAKEIDIYVFYPILDGLADDIETKANKLLKDCAMETVNDIYIHPTDGITAFLDEIGRDILSSKVDCSHPFVAKEILSVPFEDHYFIGSIYAEFCDLRSVTIDLRTGTEVLLKDIVKLDDDAFYPVWIEKLRKKDPSLPMLDEIPVEDFKKLLKNEELPEAMDGRYTPVYYVQEQGLEIGFSYHYGSETMITRGWETALLTWDELAAFKTESDVWNLIQAGLY